MKKLFLSIVSIIGLYNLGNAQETAHTGWVVKPEARWADHGFWVVKGQVKEPKQHTIYYYDNNKELIHTETLDGRKLDISKRKIQKELNKKLMLALESRAAKNKGNTQPDLLANKSKE